MEPIAKAFVADPFFHLFGAAKLHTRGALGFLRRHAGAKVFVDQQLEVRANLLVEVLVDTPREKEISEKTAGFDQERHATPLQRYRVERVEDRCDEESRCFLNSSEKADSSLRSE